MATEVSRTQREVPSGKVYRQIFDAEVQLVKALENSGTKKDATAGDGDGKRGQQPLQGIPVVEQSRSELGTGMLTSRQRTWMEGFPNESMVENPVLYKYYNLEEQIRAHEPESSMASKEVRGLPDVLAPSKVGSDIIERIAESRKQRHDAAVEDMHQDLGLVSTDLEPKISAAGEELIGCLAENDALIDRGMAKIESDDDLIRYSQSGLDDLWMELGQQSTLRQAWIGQMDETLADIECDRMDQVRDIFQVYSEQLQKTAHLMPPDLSRMLDKESQLINQTVLSNRRACADLYARLMMSDIDREKKLHTRWCQRVRDWKDLHTIQAVEDFKSFMESSEIVDPPRVQAVMEDMYTAQKQLNERRLELISSLQDLVPPASTKSAVYQWNQQITDISKQIDQLNQEYFNKVYAEYEAVCQECLGKLENIKGELVASGVCTTECAQQVINDQCLPLVGERQTVFEKDLEAMDKTLETHNGNVLTMIKSLFKFCQGVAHVWDVHELGLAKQERHLQEKLDGCRHRHDNHNQDKEANLDIVMDRMRQDASEQALRDSLKKALDMLEKIKEGYFKFHKDQMDIVASYPNMVQDELARYDRAICRFFGVDRKHPQEKIRDREPSEEREESGSQSSRSRSSKKKRAKSGSRPSSRTSESPGTARQEDAIPLTVIDTISTKKGTTFYVLSIAPSSEQEVATSSGQAQDEGQAEEDTFLTEVAPVEETPSDLPHYIQSVDVPTSIIDQVKQMIRLSFLDQLEDWAEQAITRSDSVVAAKNEELNSELDLRLHLHEPRSHRAELDVHNVRAAELVIHSERVSRHCKGINQALADLKQRFNHMTQEHNNQIRSDRNDLIHHKALFTLSDNDFTSIIENIIAILSDADVVPHVNPQAIIDLKKAHAFREDIQALEIVFMNATKSSKLVSLSNQLQVEQDAYMDVIRASLRQFRKHLDDTLQMLRESNARFIKSFKVFSDGGNFCPEEIEEYRKKLEKMSHKVDSAEGFIMADLEGMESKRLDQASKIAREFEDRFKHHMIDLLFMEKMARWLTNTQVKVKAEVADSNSQAQKLGQYLNDLERRIDACEKPNLDKEHVTPIQLNDSLKSMFEAFHNRSLYLNCVKDSVPRPTSATLQGAPAVGARVGFAAEPQTTTISRPGKQPQEDPSVPIIKNILKTQKTKMRFGAETDLDGDLPAYKEYHAPQQTALVSASQQTSESRNDRSKSRTSRASDSDSRSRKSASKPGTATNSTSGDGLRRAQSGELYRRKASKIDKKYYVFGDGPEDGADLHFLGRIRRVLREALDGLLSASELYYRQKGMRPVTRPQALQESFELCADTIVHKLQSYYKQADDYHNQCLQELRGQLVNVEEAVAHVPNCVVHELLEKAVDDLKQQRNQLNADFGKKLATWEKIKKDHDTLLRPSLGHPQQVSALKALGEKEAARHEQYMEGVEQHMVESQRLTIQHAQSMIEQLARLTEGLLLQFDNFLTVDDIDRGRVPPLLHPTSELLRRRNAGQPLEDDEDKDKMPRGKKNWPGIPKTELVLPGTVLDEKPAATPSSSKKRSSSKIKKEQSNLTASVTTAKTTLGHNAVLEARNKAYQEYKIQFGLTLSSIEEERNTHTVAEDRWTDSWATSVEKVRQLY